MVDLLGNRIVKGNMGNTVFLSHSYKDTGNILHRNCKVSVLTTLERRFNLQSADVGVIASSFEIGNLALILFVSYFGARGHRPRLIGCGGIVMALGALLSALPEFLTHQYEYESGEIRWGAEGRDVCAVNGSTSDERPDPDLICRNRTATNMMYLLLIGAQVLLGIGATPVQPLGVSYIDDHVRRKDSSLYIVEGMPQGLFSMCCCSCESNLAWVSASSSRETRYGNHNLDFYIWIVDYRGVPVYCTLNQQ
ncbi:hypothetical protein DUI87_29096 [Hirundo rustica rustica]|uniref:Major facilitator superfamily (MFS) profile domain-containing protein n=1 Tax=Hirundo rustica rustica TaxID=333673 RepID=A0A3M0J6A2_HIRRU|nr:hypothetical protein DUI87_29096 [Hirundo rustica rustica]